MYKLTTQIANANLVLVRKKLGDGSCAALVVMRSPRRYASGEAPKPKSRKLLWGTIGATVLTGAAVVYAKSSPEARNWLASNAPWANDFVAFIYQENNKFAVTNLNKGTVFIKNFLFGKEGVPPLEIKPASKQDLEKDAAVGYAKKTYDLPPPKFEPLYVEEPKFETPEIETKATLIQTEECEPQTAAPVKITKDLVELEHDMHENTKKAVDNYKQATQHCQLYNRNLHRVVESSLPDLDKRSFSILQSAQKERDEAASTAKEATAKARLALESLDRLIKAGVEAPPESIAQTQRYIKQFRTDLELAEKTYNSEAEKSLISDKYWNKVEQAREAYKTELQILFPGVDLASRKLDIKGDTDLLLLYTLKQILFLQNELAEMQTVRDAKLTRALDCKDDKALIEVKVEDIVKKERLQKIKEFELKALEIQAEANRKLNEQLRKQYEVQQDVLQDKMKRKEAEIMYNFNRLVNEKMQTERVEFKKELAGMAGKLQAIEQTLKQRANLEAEAKRSQSLWAAGEALLAATRRNADKAKIDSELKALENAGKNDNLVQTVLKGIPTEAREKGVITEKALRLKFEEMEKTAKKVALVGKDGASLPVYFLSWLQSKLLFSGTAIPKDELENLPTDFTKLDTFDIIQRAKYHMDHGNLTDALRYVNLLQGAPRAAASKWLDAARRHLEIKQAAEAVMAHASVSGLLYL